MSREEIFHGNFCVVRDTGGAASGRQGTGIHQASGAACIVAEFEDGKLLLERQYPTRSVPC